MSFFPFFIELNQKDCVIIGGGRIAAHKAKVLLSFGAKLKVIAPDFCQEFEGILSEYPKTVTLQKKVYEEGDLSGAFLCVAATDEEEINRSVAFFCEKNKILYNVVDQKELCGFYFPSYVKKGEFVVAVSSGGNSPLLTQKVKRKVEEILPDYIEELNQQLGALRDFAKEHFVTEKERKEFYQKVAAKAESLNRALTREELEEIKKQG